MAVSKYSKTMAEAYDEILEQRASGTERRARQRAAREARTGPLDGLGKNIKFSEPPGGRRPQVSGSLPSDYKEQEKAAFDKANEFRNDQKVKAANERRGS